MEDIFIRFTKFMNFSFLKDDTRAVGSILDTLNNFRSIFLTK